MKWQSLVFLVVLVLAAKGGDSQEVQDVSEVQQESQEEVHEEAHEEAHEEDSAKLHEEGRKTQDDPNAQESQEAQADPSQLSVQRIFDSDDFSGEFYSARWLPSGGAYTRLEESEKDPPGRDIVRYDAATGESQVLVPAALLTPPGTTAPLRVDDYAWSDDLSLLLVYTNSRRVWRRNTRGDYWLLDRGSRQLRQLGGDAPEASLMFAKISPDGQRVAYVRDRNIYVEDLRDHTITPLTHTKSKHVIQGTFDWVYEEELGLRDGFRWSPDGRHIAYWRLDTEGVPRIPLINNTDALYPEITSIAYPKVGQQNSACRVGVVEVDDGTTRWFDIPGDPRNHYLARMEWVPETGLLLIQQLNRLQNTNRLMLADAATGTVHPLFIDQDEAWVDVHDELFWLEDAKRFTWISERDGWRHVYLVSREDGEAKLVTPGDFDVIELLAVDERAGLLYFIASPDNPTQRFLYRMGLDGRGLARVTPDAATGSHSYRLSPRARWALHSASTFDEPPTTELVDLPEHNRVRELEANDDLREQLSQLSRQPTEFFRVDIGEGVLLDGWCIKPPDLNESDKYPLLVFVYGEPAGQTVVDRYGGKRYLWHLLLAQQGYVVMSIDNRGTPAPRGRAWRKCVYRQVGVLAPREQAAAVRKVLSERPYLDPDRVGVWGWSGGGSMSLNAIFKFPELYRTAIAVAPVPNQRYYDTIYQERYMGMPGDNVQGYVEGSAINFAEQLEGNLLIVHGTGDDNCHYQTTEMLIDELIRHNKPFTMMAYPNRTHAIRERKSTVPHLYALMHRYLLENLPSGPQ